MLKTYLFIIAALLVSISAQTRQDSTAVKQTVLNYAEGWYSGNSERMEKAISTELVKRGIVPAQDGKGIQILPANYKQMLEWTKMQPDLLKNNPGVVGEVEILFIGKNMASAKCIMRDYLDILQLVKIKEEWKILNAIWEPNFDNVIKK